MNAEQKQEWIAALRGGNYQQTQHTLHDDRGFCCLGVCAVVTGVAKPEELYVGPVEEAGDDEGPPHVYNEVRALLGKENASVYNAVIGLNDEGRSFNEIADFLEERLKTTE